jgi:hypothetical protein
MNKAVWKFQIEIKDIMEIDMPKGSEILCVQNQKEIPCIWALVNPEASMEKRTFNLVGTGHDISIEDFTRFMYIGSFQLYKGSLVFHLFENTIGILTK